MSRMRIFALAAALLVSVAALAPTTAKAENMSDVLISAENPGKLQSFSRNEYYIRAGGTPPSIEALAANPKSFFRHEMAYQVFKRGFEIQLGRELGDGALKRLLSSTKVELRDCVGSIYTTGVDRNGNVAWFTRACADGEQLLWLTANGKKVVVASMGCLNLVDAPIIGKPPAPVVMSGGGFTPPPATCTGEGCNPPPPPPPCEGKKCEPPPPPPCKGNKCEPKPEKPKGNNGWGNGDQSAPGNSGPNNDAENNGNEEGDKPDPSHGGNAGGNQGGNGQGGEKGKGDKGKKD